MAPGPFARIVSAILPFQKSTPRKKTLYFFLLTLYLVAVALPVSVCPIFEIGQIQVLGWSCSSEAPIRGRCRRSFALS